MTIKRCAVRSVIYAVSSKGSGVVFDKDIKKYLFNLFYNVKKV